MTVWWPAVALLGCVLSAAHSLAPSPSDRYEKSFRLTRTTRAHVQQLLKKYKEQHLGNMHFEDRSQQLKSLPSLSTDFYSWLNLTDWERLHAAFWDMQIYWNMLDWKRKQLEKEDRDHKEVRWSISHIQWDLRDLMNQVKSQMNYMRRSWSKATSPTVHPPLNTEASSKTAWDSRVEGYIILRDLDLYLTKLARDFLLLASKTRS
ncbi:uncharacterized protein LOC114869109 [Betta splendens]|uniref:Uncharacterized protein LOC114869109 n=1 Tax=Betta splendens TaxID=158456 RepID=A0A6P7PLE9_BETSP|nr:uncharacterized protein LOC114869109 [Betta splendens]